MMIITPALFFYSLKKWSANFWGQRVFLWFFFLFVIFIFPVDDCPLPRPVYLHTIQTPLIPTPINRMLLQLKYSVSDFPWPFRAIHFGIFMNATNWQHLVHWLWGMTHDQSRWHFKSLLKIDEHLSISLHFLWHNLKILCLSLCSVLVKYILATWKMQHLGEDFCGYIVHSRVHMRELGYSSHGGCSNCKICISS